MAVPQALAGIARELLSLAGARVGTSPTGAVWRTVHAELLGLRAPGNVVARAVPVCASLPARSAQPLTDALLAVLPHLAWARNASYRDATFLERYGYCELIGDGPWPSTTVRVGVLLLAAQTDYPAHAHPAEEIYLVLDGAAHWTVGAAAARVIRVGESVHHPPGVAHGMRTTAAPLLALYCWRGAIDVAAQLIQEC